jgi:hypothetical protein
VFRQRPELWQRGGYMKPCVERDLTCGRRLHEAVCRQRPELWQRVGYMNLYVDRDENCG